MSRLSKEALWVWVYNDSAANISRGAAVYISGEKGNTPTISLAKADSTSTLPAVGLTFESIGVGKLGRIVIVGKLFNFGDSTWSAGDKLYVSDTTAGELTTTAPTIEQLIGIVGADNEDEGCVIVLGGVAPNSSASGMPTATGIGDRPIWDGTSWTVTDDNYVANERSGFPNRTDSTMTFTDATRTVSIQPVATNFDYYQGGFKYTSTGDTLVIPDVEGLHFCYYDAGVLTSTQDVDMVDTLIRTKVLATFVYWDATNSTHVSFADERHGMQMSGSTHAFLHFVLGTQYLSGLSLTDVVTDGDGDLATSCQFGHEAGAIADEDIYCAISAVATPANIPVWYRDGVNGYWRAKTADDYPVIHDGTAGHTGLVAWNELTGGAWQLTAATNNDFVLIHIFGTNDLESPIIAVCGQAEYGNRSRARAGAETELNDLVTSGLAIAEFKPLFTLIVQTSTGYANIPQARFVSTDAGDDYIDWRGTTLSPSTAATSHSGLSDLTWTLAGHRSTSGVADLAGFDATGTAVVYPLSTVGDASYLRLDCSNGPLTGDLGIDGDLDVTGAITQNTKSVLDTDHNAWTTSGHTSASGVFDVAGFNASGDAILYPLSTVGDATYLRLDCGNIPLTDDLYVQKESANVNFVQQYMSGGSLAMTNNIKLLSSSAQWTVSRAPGVAGSTTMYFDPQVSDGTSGAVTSFFRYANTTGASVLRIYTGSDTTVGSYEHQLVGQGADSTLCRSWSTGGKGLVIGANATASASYVLDVRDNTRVDGDLRVEDAFFSGGGVTGSSMVYDGAGLVINRDGNDPYIRAIGKDTSVLTPSAGGEFTMKLDSSTGFGLFNAVQKRTGGAVLYMDASPSDGTSGCAVRYGVYSYTTGPMSMAIYQPNALVGSGVRHHLFSSSGSGVAYISELGGTCAIGGNTISAGYTCEVHGDLKCEDLKCDDIDGGSITQNSKSVLDTDHNAWVGGGHTGAAYGWATFDVDGDASISYPVTSAAAYSVVSTGATSTIDDDWLSDNIYKGGHKAKGSDTIRTATAVLANDPDLEGFTVAANTMYAVEIFFTFISNAGANFKCYLAGPALMTFKVKCDETGSTGAFVLDSAGSPAVLTGTANDEMATCVGYIKTGANSGTVAFQWSQNSSNPGNTIVRTGSWMKITEMN